MSSIPCGQPVRCVTDSGSAAAAQQVQYSQTTIPETPTSGGLSDGTSGAGGGISPWNVSPATMEKEAEAEFLAEKAATKPIAPHLTVSRQQLIMCIII